MSRSLSPIPPQGSRLSRGLALLASGAAWYILAVAAAALVAGWISGR